MICAEFGVVRKGRRSSETSVRKEKAVEEMDRRRSRTELHRNVLVGLGGRRPLRKQRG